MSLAPKTKKMKASTEDDADVAERVMMTREDENENESNDDTSSSSLTSSSTFVDNPCWGSGTRHSLRDLLSLPQYSRQNLILYESPDFIGLHKPPDLRMDGDYPATVHKLLNYLYPPQGTLQDFEAPVSESRREKDEEEGTDIETQQKGRDISNNKEKNEKASGHDDENNDKPRLRPCHQLDYATSGVLLVARTRQSANWAQQVFEQRRTQKEYLAIVMGRLEVQPEKRWPVLSSQQQLDQHWKALEKFHKQSHKSKRLRKPETFAGFMPPHAMFDIWKQRQRQKEKAKVRTQHNYYNDDDSSNGHDSNAKTTDITNEKKASTVAAATLLSEEEWQRVWAPVEKANLDLAAILACTGKDGAATVKFKDLKPLKQHVYFAEAADIYNNIRRQQVEQAKQESYAAMQLPLIFCMANDANPNNGPAANDNAVGAANNNKSSPSSSFYICASIADVPNQFAVVLNAEETRNVLVPNSHLLYKNRDDMKKAGSDGNRKHHKKAPQQDQEQEKLLFRPALTKVTILEHVVNKEDGRVMTKVKLEPCSGRRHQLRIHMAFAGHAIVGDPTYNKSKSDRRSRRQGGARMCLHAHKLRIPLFKKKDDDSDDDDHILELVAPDPFIG